MSSPEIFLLSAYLKKWSYRDNRITVNYSFTVNGNYYRKHVDLRLRKNNTLGEEFLHDLTRQCAELQENPENASPVYDFPGTRKKLENFFQKITKSFRNNKRGGKTKMIQSRSLDFFYNEADYQQLDESIRFFVHLNRGLNKTQGDLWSHAISDFRQAAKYQPDNSTLNKYMAQALNKTGRFEEAVEPLKIYADSENSPEALAALALAYINLEEFEKADDIYRTIAEKFNDTLTANFGRAQVAYKRGADYMSYLEKAREEDSEWTIRKLRKNWEYRLPQVAEDEEKLWNAASAARHLGIEKPIDLTRKAFNKEIPCYFDEEQGTIRFAREELECWKKLHEYFDLSEEHSSVDSFPGRDHNGSDN